MKKLTLRCFTMVGTISLLFLLPFSEAVAEDLPESETQMEVKQETLAEAKQEEKVYDLKTVKEALDIGSSVVLVSTAWEALENNDLESVLKLTKKCIGRYGKRAQQMQEELKEYVTAPEATIRSYWALNDVATALFIQGKALQNAERYDEAKEVYQKLLNEYSFGQCWDPKGWFWKPAEVAKENLAMIESGVFFDFGDYSSSTLVIKAWEALEKGDIELVEGYVDKCIKLYESRAREMQAELEDYPKGTDDEIFGYWALNDVATAHFIKGRAYVIAGKEDEAAREFKIIRDELFFGQCWDPRGWWWKPATEASNWLEMLDDKAREAGAS